MGWKGDSPVGIMVGVLRGWKGPDGLLKGNPPLRALVPNVKVKLVGDGELESAIRQEASPLADSIEFLGQRMDVPELLGASDVLILPSWSEALPTVLIEAGAAGLPVVATRVGGTAEIVEDERTGYIVNPGDADGLADSIIRLLNDPSHAREMGDHAYQRIVNMFSLGRQAKSTVALYETLLKSRHA